ncbi:MAG: hypothetical protein P9F75_00670 [Candidatus Contendobacter sp.]|nr:hypothetical protein [Candidatus Contendobacter sp.]
MLAKASEELNDDKDYSPWSDTQHAADAMAFDAWLQTPDGKAWLAAEEFESISKREGYGPCRGVTQ